jgi:subtilisin family serine protease
VLLKRKYVILHHSTGVPVKKRRLIPTAVSLTEPPKVEVGDLEPQLAANLAQKKFVMAMAPVIPMKLIAPVAINCSTEPDGDMAWGIHAVGADTSPFTGEGITVAVLDTGIDPSHPAFTGINIVRKNFTEESDDDENGHGTHCAGTIFGRDVDGTRIGVAPGVTKALVGKVLGEGSGSDQIAQAIQWAVNCGANVISMSLRIDFPGYVKLLEHEGIPTELATSMALEGYRANLLLFERLAAFIAAQNAFKQATVLVAAAGNESQRDIDPDFEIAVSPPAVADGFISVAAVANSPKGFTVAPFSNWGARVSGPGVDILSAKCGGGFISLSGTSMATPHVAGVAALWAQKLVMTSELVDTHLEDRLTGTATTSGMKPGFSPHDIGTGLVQAPQN